MDLSTTQFKIQNEGTLYEVKLTRLISCPNEIQNI